MKVYFFKNFSIIFNNKKNFMIIIELKKKTNFFEIKKNPKTLVNKYLNIRK